LAYLKAIKSVQSIRGVFELSSGVVAKLELPERKYEKYSGSTKMS